MRYAILIFLLVACTAPESDTHTAAQFTPEAECPALECPEPEVCPDPDPCPVDVYSVTGQSLAVLPAPLDIGDRLSLGGTWWVVVDVGAPESEGACATAVVGQDP